MSSKKIKSSWFLERKGINQYCIRLLQGSNKIGRISNCEIIMSQSKFISREHCDIIVHTSDIELIDHSSNGTYVNDGLIRNDNKILLENDTIGIGVDVLEEELSDLQYHVYILKKISSNNKKIIKMCPSVINLLDSEDEETIENIACYSKNVKSNKSEIDILSNSIIKTNTEQLNNVKNKITIISNVLISQSKTVSNNEILNTVTVCDNKLQLSEGNKTDNEIALQLEETCSRVLPFSFASCNRKRKVKKDKIYTIDITSDDESISIPSKHLEAKLNSSIVISDDEDFECSQYILQDVKQEMNDFECEDIDKNKNLTNLSSDDYDDDKHFKISSPVYELLNNDTDEEDDEEDEFDENLANWFMKLSQGIAVKQELKEEDAFYENKGENLSNKITKLEHEAPQNNKLKYIELNMINGKLVEQKFSEKQIQDLSESRHMSNCDLINKSEPNTKGTNKVPEIIDAPRLPIFKGKLRGVSANQKSCLNLEKKNLLLLTDIKLNYEKDLKAKWSSKFNMVKEKEKRKLIHNDRKEKLKRIADKNIQKNKSIEAKEIKVLKTPKVKVTVKNRGAFLTEISSDKCNVEASSSANLKRRNSETENKSKLSKIPKIVSKSILNETEKKKNHLVNEHKSRENSHPQKNQLKKPVQDNFSAAIESFENSTEISQNIKPEKLSFKSLKVTDNTILKPLKVPTIVIKSILSTKPKSERNQITKKVRFVEKPLINYYNRDINAVPKKVIQKDATFDLSLLSERKKLRLRTITTIDHSDLMISEILSWNANWLEAGTEEVNGPNNLIMPMVHHFQSLSEYENTIFPLLKLELWAQLRRNFNDGNMNNYANFLLNNFQVNKKDCKKIIFYCQYTANKNQPIFLTGDLILIQIQIYKLFGYIRENSFVYDPKSSFYSLTIESKLYEELLPNLAVTKTVKAQKLSSITIELGQFNAVRSLKYSPLLKYVLNPINLVKSISMPIDNVKYEGYHKLNKLQENITLHTYLKCIDPKKPNITLIEGPPGTGKSLLVSNLALQILYGQEVRKLDRRILICAPSNAAIDVITLKLIHIRNKITKLQSRFNLLRFGVYERMHPDVRMYSLTGLIEYNRKIEKINRNSLENEKKFIEAKISKIKENNNQNTVDQDELNKLKQNLNHINCLLNPNSKTFNSDKLLYPKFLSNAHIICSTLPSCVKLLKYIRFFDVCIIDESTQCSEPWALIPFQFRINSLVLIGDKQQLPAIVLSKQSKEYNYDKSLFTRISESIENNSIHNPIMTLDTQYRMHPEICRWPNSYFYKNKLINDITVKQYMLKLKPYSIFNLEYSQNKTTESGNISNTLEARFVVELIKHLIEFMPITEYNYGIISPYTQHRDNLQKQLKESKIQEIRASTIDSYQGKEKDIIIISNGRTEGVGFLFDVGRLNVCLTRAKKCLILCGNFSNLYHLPAWKSLLQDAKSRNIYYNLNNKDIDNFKENIMSKIIQ